MPDTMNDENNENNPPKRKRAIAITKLNVKAEALKHQEQTKCSDAALIQWLQDTHGIKVGRSTVVGWRGKRQVIAAGVANGQGDKTRKSQGKWPLLEQAVKACIDQVGLPMNMHTCRTK